MTPEQDYDRRLSSGRGCARCQDTGLVLVLSLDRPPGKEMAASYEPCPVCKGTGDA